MSSFQVNGFGMNYAEMHMRRGERAETAGVSGIECVGPVKSAPDGDFKLSSKAAALMGAWGERSMAATRSTRVTGRQCRIDRVGIALGRACR
jgi:hypothetical protein